VAIAFVAIHSPEPMMPWQRLVVEAIVARRQPEVECSRPNERLRSAAVRLKRSRERATIGCPVSERLLKTSPSRRW
jgi:hypothetical protein